MIQNNDRGEETHVEQQPPAPFFVYILQCVDDTLYTGWTNDLEKRVAAHNSGRGAKYTRARRPVKLVYWEKCETKQAAMRREWQIKQLPRPQKLALMRQAGFYGTQYADRSEKSEP